MKGCEDITVFWGVLRDFVFLGSVQIKSPKKQSEFSISNDYYYKDYLETIFNQCSKLSSLFFLIRKVIIPPPAN